MLLRRCDTTRAVGKRDFLQIVSGNTQIFEDREKDLLKKDGAIHLSLFTHDLDAFVVVRNDPHARHLEVLRYVRDVAQGSLAVLVEQHLHHVFVEAAMSDLITSIEPENRGQTLVADRLRALLLADV